MPQENKETTEPTPRRLPNHDAEHDLIRRLVHAHLDRLGNMRANPKGMTHADVQSDLKTCASILDR